MRKVVGVAAALGVWAGVAGQTQAAPINLLTNGSFETFSGGVFTGWSNGGSIGTTPAQYATQHPTDGTTVGQHNEAVPSAPISNSPDSKSTTAPFFAGGGRSFGAYFVADEARPAQTLSQTVTLEKDAFYEAGVSLYATKNGDANSGFFRLTVTIDGQTVATAPAAIPVVGAWQNYATTFTASGTSAVFNFAFSSGDTPAKDIIADLAYVFATGTTPLEVPEPATVALLGMGLMGLGAMRRRT